MLAHRLTQITVKFISLVAAGANRREFVAKAKADGSVGFEVEARLVKVDDALREVSGALYPAGQVDTQGDFVTAEDWDLAMLDFQAKGRGAAGVSCDINHDEQPTGDYLVEVYRTIADDPRWPDETPGTWIVTRKIVDDARWEAVKSGTFKAFSFGGTAVRIPNQVVRKDDPIKRQVLALCKGPLADALARREIPNLIEATYQALWDAYHGTDMGAEKPALAEVVAELQAELSKENHVDKSMLKKLADAIAALFVPLVEEAPESSLAPISGAEPATKSDEVLDDVDKVADAVAAAKAEHLVEVEALKAAHAAELASLNEKIEALEKLTPDSGRHDHNGTGDGGVSGGVFAGRVQ
jgi:hypothetical protein